MPTLHPVRATLRLTFEHPFHVGTGRAEGLVNRTIRRTALGAPYVPGSALKGALRETAERLVFRLDEDARILDELIEPAQYLGYRRRGSATLSELCRAPRPEGMCQSKTPCIVCRLFGNVFTGTRLLVSDARLAPEAASAAQEDIETRTQVQIDRRRRGAKHGALFTSEFARPAGAFEATLEGQIPLTPLPDADADAPWAEAVLLAATIAATDHIGAGTSSGLGQCRLVARPDGDSPKGPPAEAESENGAAPSLHLGGTAYALADLVGGIEALAESLIPA